MYVLRPLDLSEIKTFFDKDARTVIDFFIKKSIFSQPERKPWQNILPVQIPKEHIEQWVVQALWVEWIGAWSYPVDVINRTQKWGADIKMLSASVDDDWNFTAGDSGETSLAQKFQWTWNELDQLFANKEYERIKTEWLEIYVNKLNEVVENEDLVKVYYFILLRGWDKLHIVWMEVILNNIKNVSVDTKRTTLSSVFLKGFINDTLWYLKIYKAKKRLELRLKPKKWLDNWYCLTFELDTMIDNTEIDLLEMIKNKEDLNKYWLEKAQKLFTKKSL